MRRNSFFILFVLFLVLFLAAQDGASKSLDFKFTDGSFRPTQVQRIWLRRHLHQLQSRFPKLTTTVLRNGYEKILFEKRPQGKLGRVALAQLQKDKKTLVLYERFFSTSRVRELERLPYSFAQVTLLHELLHGYDERSQKVTHNLDRLGWKLQEKKTEGFRIHSLPWIENSWITHAEAMKIAKFTEKAAKPGEAWGVHLEAAKKSQVFGYPTIYSVVGGPTEAFAELGAYIALDPSAKEYVPTETIRWFQEEVLF